MKLLTMVALLKSVTVLRTCPWLSGFPVVFAGPRRVVFLLEVTIW
jgi:hypothetical protein